MYMEGSLWLALCLPFKGLVQTLFFVIYQNLGADFCTPKSGYRSQEHLVLHLVLLINTVWKKCFLKTLCSG